MKKRITALALALVFCLTLLTACSSKNSARRDVAMDLFGITSGEYRKNQEYYDTMLNLYAAKGLVDTGGSGGEGEQAGEGWYNDDTGWEYAKSRYTEAELEEAFQGHYDVIAVKKGGTFHTCELFDYDTDTYYAILRNNLTRGFGWRWPDVSYSEGDSLVMINGEQGNDEYLYTYKLVAYCLPFSFQVSTRVEDPKAELQSNFDYWEASLADGTENAPEFKITAIDGVAVTNSSHYYVLESLFPDMSYAYDRILISGEKGETITLSGVQDDPGSADYDYYNQERTASYRCTYQYYEVGDVSYGEPDGPNAHLSEDGSAYLNYNFGRPSDGVYRVLSNSETQRIPAGEYILNGFPITIKD